MENIKIGQFICELRKEKQMTQKDLAEKLHITDKAVSKWERGLSCPDIALLPDIAKLFGVTVGELLNGEKGKGDAEEAEESINNVLQYADNSVKRKAKSLRDIYAQVFSLMLLCSIVTCVICDMAIGGSLSWSYLVMSANIFSWLVFFPVIKFRMGGVTATLISFSVFVIPYLWVLDTIISGKNSILPIGVPMAIIAVVFLWIVYFVFKALGDKKFLATGICLVAVIPAHVLINYILMKKIHSPLFDMWDVLSVLIIGIVALIFLYLHFCRVKRRAEQE